MKLPQTYVRNFNVHASSGVKSLRNKKSLRFYPRADARDFSRKGIKI